MTVSRHPTISSQLFADRRKRFMKRMVKNSLAIFYSNDPMPRSGDTFFPYRQNSDLFALCGLDQEGTILVLYPGAKNENHRELAFVIPHDPERAVWTGKRYTLKEAQKISGIQSIYKTSEWDKILPKLIRSAGTIYTNPRPSEDSEAHTLSRNDRMDAILKSQYPDHEFLSAGGILRSLAMIKHPAEIDLLKSAIAVTRQAFDRVLRTIKPGMKEYEVESEITYTFSRHGCHHAFEPIVASGKSACTLHYVRNNQVIKKNDLVLLDFGAEYAYMASDMSRTIPASGRFTARQRDMYSAVLHVLEEMTTMMVPGVTLKELNVEAGKLIDRELVRLKIVSQRELRRQDAKSPIRKKYFMHGISHHLGYDVHDIYERAVPLKAGMVLTCEPGLYIREEKTGIRLENDILITRKKPINLMAGIPIYPEEIEEIMNNPK